MMSGYVVALADMDRRMRPADVMSADVMSADSRLGRCAWVASSSSLRWGTCTRSVVPLATLSITRSAAADALTTQHSSQHSSQHSPCDLRTPNERLPPRMHAFAPRVSSPMNPPAPSTGVCPDLT